MKHSIKKYPIGLIFKKILKESLNGQLKIRARMFVKVLYFMKGRLAFATTSKRDEHLGEILVSLGTIDRTTQKKVIDRANQTHRQTGDILIEMCGLTARDIFFTLSSQMKIIAQNSFAVDDGDWEFTEGVPKIPNRQHFKIKVSEIIQKGVKEIVDFSFYQNKFLLRAPVSTIINKETTSILSKDEIDFYNQLDGFSNISVKNILSQIKLPRNLFWKRIVLLYLLNIIDFVDFISTEASSQKIEDINELYDQIHLGKVNYYSFLDLKNSATTEEIKQTFEQYRLKYSPDNISAAPDSTLILKAGEVFAQIKKAFETLGNQEKRAKYDAVKNEKPGPPSQKKTLQSPETKNLYAKALSLYNQEKYFDATLLLERAVNNGRLKANYLLLLGMCQAKSPSTQNLAEENLKKSAKMEPWNADPLFQLGSLYRSLNFNRKASDCFKRALAINMEHTLAGKEMEKMRREALSGKARFKLFSKK